MPAETESGEEKTEAPTGKRRDEARSKGQVAKSQEVGTVAVLFGGLSALYLLSTFLYNRLYVFLRDTFKIIARPDLNDADFTHLFSGFIIYFLLTIMPILGIILLFALIVTVIQVGGIKFSWEAIKPKFSSLNPISGIKKVMLSMQSLMMLVKSVAKLFIVGIVAYSVVVDELDFLLNLTQMEIPAILLYIMKIMAEIFLKVSVVMIFLAILDYSYQKYEYEKNLKMTKQEIKDETKQTEGDPQIKSRIKAAQREIAKRRMMESVPKADVVVTNPVHLAIAIGYDKDKMNAPTVLAKGAGQIAFNIKSKAREFDIPIVENKELARNLFKMVEIGHEIPVTLYQAVAEVLAYVYRLKGKV